MLPYEQKKKIYEKKFNLSFYCVRDLDKINFTKFLSGD